MIHYLLNYSKSTLLIVSTLFIVIGCGSSGSYFILTGPSVIEKHYSKKLPVVGIEKISLPEYMQQGKVAIQLSPTQIKYANSDKWAEDMESSLTKQLIKTVQKSFNTPNIYLYPWDLSRQADIKVNVSINRFIAFGQYVYLDASWKIVDLRNKKEFARLYSTKVPCGKDIKSVVSSMNRAFSKLSEKLVRDLSRI